MADAPITRGDPTQPPMMGRMIPEFYECAITGEERVKIMYPGDQLREPHFVASLEYQVRFPVEWRAFKEQTDQFEGQTRIENVAWIDPASTTHSRRCTSTPWRRWPTSTTPTSATWASWAPGSSGSVRSSTSRLAAQGGGPRQPASADRRADQAELAANEGRSPKRRSPAPRPEPRSWTGTAPRPPAVSGDDSFVNDFSAERASDDHLQGNDRSKAFDQEHARSRRLEAGRARCPGRGDRAPQPDR